MSRNRKSTRKIRTNEAAKFYHGYKRYRDAFTDEQRARYDALMSRGGRSEQHPSVRQECEAEAVQMVMMNWDIEKAVGPPPPIDPCARDYGDRYGDRVEGSPGHAVKWQR